MITAVNASDLRALPYGEAVQLLGYYTPGDGGEGLYVPRDTGVAPDNGGTRIGRWKRAVSNHLDVRWFGARGDGEHDDLPAFTAAIEALGPEDSCTGGQLVAGPGQWRMKGSLVIDRGLRLTGAVGYRNMAATQLLFDDGFGVLFPDCPVNWGGRNPAGRYGANALLEHVMIRSLGDGQGVSYPDAGGVLIDRPVAHGVWAKSTFRMRDCFIVGFNGDGIFIDSNSDEGGDWPNCNAFQVEGVSAENCTQWGFHPRGGNAQGGSVINFLGMSNGRGHILDECFLGNTYINPMMHTPLFPGRMPCQGLRVSGDVNKTVVIGGYTEGDCAPSHVDGAAVVYGGNYGNGWTPESKGLRIIDYGHVSPFQVVSDPALDQSRGMRTQVGMGGNPLGWQHAADATDTKIARDPETGWYELVSGGLRTMVIMAGRVLFPDGLQVGGAGIAPRRIRFGDAAPTGHATEGDLVLAANVASSSGIGLQCTRTGYSAPPWQPGKRYDAGEYVVPSPDGDWQIYRCVQTGTSGTAQPAWPAAVGATVADGGCAWVRAPGYSAAWRVLK